MRGPVWGLLPLKPDAGQEFTEGRAVGVSALPPALAAPVGARRATPQATDHRSARLSAHNWSWAARSQRPVDQLLGRRHQGVPSKPGEKQAKAAQVSRMAASLRAGGADGRWEDRCLAQIRGWPLHCDVLPLNLKGASRFLRKWPLATLDIESPEALWPETKGQAASLARVRGHSPARCRRTWANKREAGRRRRARCVRSKSFIRLN